MRYTTMIFDIDGTLTDSAAVILHALKRTVQEITGKIYEEKELAFALGLPSHIAIKQLTGEKWEKAMELGLEYYAEALKSVRLFDGIEPTIKELHEKGTQLGIVTSKSRAQFERSFFNYSIHSYFTHIVCQDDTSFHKPDPRPLLNCAESFHADLTEVLYIGDTLSDSTCAKNAGIDFALAGWGCPSPDDVPADLLLHEPRELLSFVREAQGTLKSNS